MERRPFNKEEILIVNTEDLAGRVDALGTVLIRLIEHLPTSQAQTLADELKLDISSVKAGLAVCSSDAEKEAHLRVLGVYERTASDVAKGQ